MSKKGNRSWKPATQLATFKKDPNFVYRYCEDTPPNIDRKLQEQWEPVNRSTDPGVQQDTGNGHGVDGALRHRELVLMRMPKETADARNKFFEERTDKQERGAKELLQADLRKGGEARAYGSVEIGKQIID